MWKLNKFSVIFSVLFLSLLACFSPLTQLKANAIESYKISPEDERTFKRSIYQNAYIPESQNVDIHYYFYATNNYAEDISLIIYSCDYYDYNTGSVAKKSGCGLYLVQEAGSFKIKLTSSVYATVFYSRRTNTVSNFNGMYSSGNSFDEIARFTDEDFNKGLTLLGGTTLKENSWNREEGGFLLDPIGGNSGGSSSGSNNNGGINLDFGAFVKGIVDGITEFFRPMMDSVGKTANAVGSIVGDLSKALGEFFKPMIDSLIQAVDWLSKLGSFIVDGITGFFQGLIDMVGKIWDFLSNFFVKLFEELGKFIKWIFVPSDDFFANIHSDFKREFGLVFEPFNQFINIEILSSTSDSACSFNLSGGVFYIDICGVPEKLLNWARIFVNFSLGLWTISRILGFIPILLGTQYVWERWANYQQGGKK